ncbi:MAG: type II and III secretion system protein, partial [Syntrophobacteraceae bacterium]
YTDPRGHSISVLGGASPPSDTLAYVFSNEFINARVALYAEDNRLEMLSAPFLMAADNVEVKFFTGKETPLRKDVTTKTIPIGDLGNTITTFQVEVTREDLGTELNISSFINADQTVTMQLKAKISTPNIGVSDITLINEKTGQPVIFPLDGVEKHELNSVLVIPSNHTVALGGIITSQNKDFQQKVPVLGDIPVLGTVFKRAEKIKERTETVILLTPHVIGNPWDGGAASSQFLEKESKIHSVEEESAEMKGSTSNPFKGLVPSCPAPPPDPLQQNQAGEE